MKKVLLIMALLVNFMLILCFAAEQNWNNAITYGKFDYLYHEIDRMQGVPEEEFDETVINSYGYTWDIFDQADPNMYEKIQALFTIVKRG